MNPPGLASLRAGILCKVEGSASEAVHASVALRESLADPICRAKARHGYFFFGECKLGLVVMSSATHSKGPGFDSQAGHMTRTGWFSEGPGKRSYGLPPWKRRSAAKLAWR